MSKLDELLKGVDVEWLALGKISKILRGRRLTKNQLTKVGNYPVFHGGLEPLGFYDLSNRKGETVMIINVGASAATIGYSTEDFWSSDGCYTIDHSIDLNNKYLYYYLTTQQFNIKSKVRYAGIPTLDAFVLEKIKIPIPCPDNPEKSLEIQQEIVRVLDELTSLTNQLTTELETERQNRKKQFEFFREQLFKEINLIKLGDNSVGEFIRGSGLQKKDFTETGVGCIHYGQLYTHYKTFAFETKTFVSEEFAKKARKASSGDLIIATTSENDDDVCKAVAWLGNVDIAVSSDACFYRHKFNPKYVAYYFQTEQFQKQKRKYITGTKVRRVNANDLAKILIPNPSLQEQERIVKLLDQFDATHTAIEEEITKEIKLRTQQYEYYREKLLSFPSLRTT